MNVVNNLLCDSVCVVGEGGGCLSPLRNEVSVFKGEYSFVYSGWNNEWGNCLYTKIIFYATFDHWSHADVPEM